MKKFLITCAVMLLPIFTSCMETTQEIWINADGSGRIKFDIGIDKTAYTQLTQMTAFGDPNGTPKDPFAEIKNNNTTLEKLPDVKKVEMTTFDTDNAKHIVVDLEVKDFLKLPELNKMLEASKNSQGGLNSAPSDSSKSNNFVLKQNDDGTVDFVMTLPSQKLKTSIDPNAAGDPNDPVAAMANGMGDMMASMFEGKYQTLILHVPSLVSTNGQKTNEQTITWKIPVGDVMKLSENKTWEAKFKLAPIEEGLLDSFVSKIKSLF